MSAAQQQQAQPSQYSSAFPSPPPPVDLGTYARSMLQHTKRQMESINQTAARQQGSTSGSSPTANGEHHQHSSSSTTNSVPNGVSNLRRNPGDGFTRY
ncbi:hypothetical protein QBC38DRAFT_141439 [Podospora fimiseda]|uniref:Uncharacterized protein n=1 Tax=Podospora fimiseda TaxID=252190 RepID=A0AAN7GX04_9PEZI|nr:hypothetical protein QBC38DRAFT_141439 [Podospora fimiseda]